MSRSTLLEMCIFALSAMPEERLGEILPTLAGLAEPYSEAIRNNDELNQCIHECIDRHRAEYDRSPQTQRV
ncbi:MAG: hypothetical protein KAU28_00665 [Phycisphaerae bacterium]|nr:hypothetical protein [Phycisphaerae bacterium]